MDVRFFFKISFLDSSSLLNRLLTETLNQTLFLPNMPEYHCGLVLANWKEIIDKPLELSTNGCIRVVAGCNIMITNHSFVETTTAKQETGTVGSKKMVC